jgi:hypothetical protein
MGNSASVESKSDADGGCDGRRNCDSDGFGFKRREEGRDCYEHKSSLFAASSRKLS